MGGTHGEVRGKSKIKVYLKYQELVENTFFENKIPDPRYKKYCKQTMEWDPETEEWVLFYRLHT
jgi:hypothetical protein